MIEKCPGPSARPGDCPAGGVRKLVPPYATRVGLRVECLHYLDCFGVFLHYILHFFILRTKYVKPVLAEYSYTLFLRYLAYSGAIS